MWLDRNFQPSVYVCYTEIENREYCGSEIKDNQSFCDVKKCSAWLQNCEKKRGANVTIRLVLGAIVGGGLGLLFNLVSTKAAKGGFT